MSVDEFGEVDDPTVDEMELIPDAYRIAGYGRVLIASRGQGTWAVTDGSMCLNKMGEYEHEPLPSNRSEQLLARTRYPSPEKAREVFRAYAQKCAETPGHARQMHHFKACTGCGKGMA